MDAYIHPDTPNLQSNRQPPIAQKKNRMLLGIISAFFIVAVSTAVLLVLRNRQGLETSQEPNKIPQQQPTHGPSVSPNPLTSAQTEAQLKESKREIIAMFEEILRNTKEGQFHLVIHHFQRGLGYWQTDKAIRDMVQNLQLRFTDNGVFTASVSLDDIEVIGSLAQVLVRHTIQGKPQTARFDIQKVRSDWKISQISYISTLDLITTQKLRQEQIAVLEKAFVSEDPVPFVLPTGDSVKLNQTLFTTLRKPGGAHEDIEITVSKAENNYRIVLFDLSRIVDDGYIIKHTPGTLFHAFDIRPLIDAGGGMVLFYPDTVSIDYRQPGKPPGAIYEIPVKIQVGN